MHRGDQEIIEIRITVLKVSAKGFLQILIQNGDQDIPVDIIVTNRPHPKDLMRIDGFDLIILDTKDLRVAKLIIHIEKHDPPRRGKQEFRFRQIAPQ